MGQAIIEIKGLSVSYERKRVLTNIYLDIEPGKVYGVIGPNGAGKSTLFKAILGLIELNAGSILINGTSIIAQRKKVVYVPQKNDVDWNFPATVYDIVQMGRYPHKSIFQRLNAEDRRIVEAALEEVGISHLAKRQIGELSGGQQQRVFLARALCQQADIFLLDEPFVGVDITTEEQIIRILKKLARQGKTTLVVHHDLSTVQEYFDKVILLNQRLIAYGDTESTFNDENISLAYGGQMTILHKTGMI
ncbi:MAG: metal ABC transporter ATP-binding protein [Bacteroidota bacterium]